MPRDHSFFVMSRDGTYNRRRIAGMIATNELNNDVVPINTLRVVSQPIPVDMVIDRLGFYVNMGAAGAKARVGIYDCVDDLGGNLYPNALLYGSSELTAGTSGLKEVTTEIGLPPNHLYWFAYLCGVAAPTIRCVPRGSVYPRLGIGSAWGVNLGIGWEASYSYGALPATFPAGASVFTGADNIPALQFGREES